MNNITIENVRIGFRNFSGKEGKFNPKGERNFVIFLEDDIAKELQNEGWNIKWLKPRNDDEEPQAILQVKVAFGKMPPNILLISSKGRTMLNEENINILDWAELKNADVILRPYMWSVSGQDGVKAYLKKMYVTLIEDDLEKKYEIVPDSGKDAIGGCGNCEVCDGNCGGGI